MVTIAVSLHRWAKLCLYLLLALWIIGPGAAQGASNATQWPVLDNGLENAIEWDHYSIILNKERLFLFGGEMHPWRLPVPELWEDILQKMKASGLTSVSFYSHWGYHSSTPETLDFTTGGHDTARFYEIAKAVGIFVTSRPGPYINAETNAGGFPLWVTTGAYGSLRNNDSRYTAAWTPYQTAIAKVTFPFQVTEGGTALLYQIENEYGDQWKNVATKTPNTESIDYVELLEANARSNGINVALTANAPNENGKSWSIDYDTVGAGGDVDIYGLDSYPACWSCVLSDCGTPVPLYTLDDYYDHFEEVSPRQPSYMPEFQGGSYNPWYGPPDGCLNATDEHFVNIYYRDNIAQRITAMSLYMAYGGTNWGWLAAPFIPTTYDYSAPISEDRSIGAKFYEMKNLALFTRVAQDLRKTDRIAQSSSYSSNPAVLATEMRNPDTNAAFYVTRHTASTSGTNEVFKLSVNTSEGVFTIPQKTNSIALNGFISKIVPTDFHFAGHTLIYSTAEVLTYAIFDGEPVLALWVGTGETGEFYIKGAKYGSVSVCNGCSNVGFYPDSHGLIVTFAQQAGMSVLQIDRNMRVILLDRTAAYNFFVPGLNNDPTVPVDQTVFVQGPYLVRSAEMKYNTISISGDSNQTSDIEVFTSKSVSQISWNQIPLKTTRTSYGSLKATIAGPQAFQTPEIGSWKVHDSLPERWLNYSDSSLAWVDANHTTTVSSMKTATIPYLYVDEYGFHTGIHLWRGYFNGSATGVYLNVQGGQNHGWSAFLNGQFIGSYLGSTTASMGNATLSFSNATLSSHGDNVLLVIQDNTGHDETSGAINVRGILNATLLGGDTSFSAWKVAGTAGGSTNTLLDPLRTIYNEGGLTGERLGWHLPGFDDSAWAPSSPSAGFAGAGVRFYRATLPLAIPDAHDVSLSFLFASPNTTACRALLYVNGYQYARFYPHIGALNAFPVPPGVLNNDGDNVVAVALWAQSEDGAGVDLHVKVNYMTTTSMDMKFDGGYLRPGWNAERLKYA